MARQVRSEVTRRRLLDAAVQVIGEVGYPAAGRVAIVERAGVTKGALYHHFDSMEALASTIIDEGATTLLGAFRGMCGSSAPALEGLIHGMFAAADAMALDPKARVAAHLVFACCDFNESAVRLRGTWLTEISAQVDRAIAEADLRDDVHPQAISEVVAAAFFGAGALSGSAAADGGPVGRLTRMWALVLPAIVAEASQGYFREFLAREVVRRQRG